MDKEKLKPYASEEELIANAENIEKNWKREEYGNYVFSARHMADHPDNPEDCLHLYLDEKQGIRSTNWAAWARYMSVHEKLRPWELKVYETRLCNEFLLWTNMEANRLAKLEKEKHAEAEKEAELTALFIAEAMSRKSKYKN